MAGQRLIIVTSNRAEGSELLFRIKLVMLSLRHKIVSLLIVSTWYSIDELV